MKVWKECSEFGVRGGLLELAVGFRRVEGDVIGRIQSHRGSDGLSGGLDRDFLLFPHTEDEGIDVVVTAKDPSLT